MAYKPLQTMVIRYQGEMTQLEVLDLLSDAEKLFDMFNKVQYETDNHKVTKQPNGYWIHEKYKL